MSLTPKRMPFSGPSPRAGWGLTSTQARIAGSVSAYAARAAATGSGIVKQGSGPGRFAERTQFHGFLNGFNGVERVICGPGLSAAKARFAHAGKCVHAFEVLRLSAAVVAEESLVSLFDLRR